MKKYLIAAGLCLAVLGGVVIHQTQPESFDCQMTYESSKGSQMTETGVKVKDKNYSFTIESYNFLIESGLLKTHNSSNKNISLVKYSENDRFTYQAKTVYADGYVNYNFKRGSIEYVVHDCKKV
jgi:uncharacterized protein with FMN-binding domain